MIHVVGANLPPVALLGAFAPRSRIPDTAGGTRLPTSFKSIFLFAYSLVSLVEAIIRSNVHSTTIIDNQGENTLKSAIFENSKGASELCIATAFFSLDALSMISESLMKTEKIRILFGDEADRTQRKKLLERLRRDSDEDLVIQRMKDPVLHQLGNVDRLFKEGKIEARCYTSKKFHAKAYISDLAESVGMHKSLGILGSGNFTRLGLSQNLELNAHLTPEQTSQLKAWFEERWNEAQDDEVTDDLYGEIRRQIDLYDPYSIYVKSLLHWGDWIQGRGEQEELKILDQLDPHQEDAYRQALKVLDREDGVMICDGVGLGKSFVALALMEHFLSKGKTAFLIAPKAILESGWEGYLQTYLNTYRRGYKSLVHEPMTWFGFNKNIEDQATLEKNEHLLEYANQAEVIVIDESHNFRKMNSQRYENLMEMLQIGLLGRKKVILLTATPINTSYTDLTSQFRLITLDDGRLGGIDYNTYRKHAVKLDTEHKLTDKDQPELDFQLGHAGLGFLEKGMNSVAIQRSRKTCKELALAKGKLLRFPEREPISTISYSVSYLYSNLIEFTRQQFEELAKFLQAYRSEVRRASGEEGKKRQLKLILPVRGLRFSAYLPDRYKKRADESLRDAQVESFLVSLVFSNVMKQMESSPAAFQGILQALGSGLCARIHHVAMNGDLEIDDVEKLISNHADWIGANVKGGEILFPEADDDMDAAAAEATGEEMDEWLLNALKNKSVQKGLAGFSSKTHNVADWYEHIRTDLEILKEIHQRTLFARNSADDKKLEDVKDKVLEMLMTGRKVLVFTQSKRTAEYIEEAFKEKLGKEVARIDASIQGDRRAKILHAFSPKYNSLNTEQEKSKLEYPINVLVSTDVLSEGVNLQEAGCILNYDIHWNPVRLIQRIGRVDRRLREDDPGHTFSIVNVVPPKEIEDIIGLVATVEGRKRMILNLLGLDQAFFSANDREGTLKEFNSMVEGEVSLRDEALKTYDQILFNGLEDIEKADAAPDGAFGVWKNPDVNGAFAAFVMKASDKTTEQDRELFGHVIDQPVLAMWNGKEVILDSPTILNVLRQTVKGEKSADPNNPQDTAQALAKMKKEVNQSFRDIHLIGSIQPRLVCCMELIKDAN